MCACEKGEKAEPLSTADKAELMNAMALWLGLKRVKPGFSLTRWSDGWETETFGGDHTSGPCASPATAVTELLRQIEEGKP